MVALGALHNMWIIGIAAFMFFSIMPCQMMVATTFTCDDGYWNYTNYNTLEDGRLITGNDYARGQYLGKDAVFSIHIPFIEISTVSGGDGNDEEDYTTYELGEDISFYSDGDETGSGNSYYYTYSTWFQEDLIGETDVGFEMHFTTYSTGHMLLVLEVDTTPDTNLHWRVYVYIDFDVDGNTGDTTSVYNLLDYNTTYDEIRSEISFGDDGTRLSSNQGDKVRQTDSSGEYIRMAGDNPINADFQYSVNNAGSNDLTDFMWLNREYGVYNTDMRMQLEFHDETSSNHLYYIYIECESF